MSVIANTATPANVSREPGFVVWLTGVSGAGKSTSVTSKLTELGFIAASA